MIHWNYLSNEEKLKIWKEFRENLIDKTIDSQLEQIATFFSSMPFGARTIDYYSPQSWPTPWEILYYSSFCTSSISLLMYYTLTLINSNAILELILVEDEDGIYLLPLIDNKSILNYELGKISSYPDIQNSVILLKRYTQDQIKSLR